MEQEQQPKVEILNKAIRKFAKGRIIFPFLITTCLVYGAMLAFTVPALSRLSGGMQILDFKPFGYSSSYALNLFEALGAMGRHFYLYRQFALDTLYPALYGITYSLLLSYIFERAFKKESRLQLLVALPLLAAFFDYLENISIVTMLNQFPSFNPALARVTDVFSILKSVSSSMFYLLIIFGLVVWAWKKMRRNN